MLPELAPDRRLILSVAPERLFVPHSRVILGRLGYAIVMENDWRQEPILAARTPELVVVGSRGWPALEAERGLRHLPRILIQEGREAPPEGAPLVGVVRGPAGLHELFRLFQQALEATPRGSVRVPTALPAQVRAGGEQWPAQLCSLSERGCLLQIESDCPVALGLELELRFELPEGSPVMTLAESVYHAQAATGVVFAETPPSARRAIARFVESQLAA